MRETAVAKKFEAVMLWNVHKLVHKAALRRCI
jgi:hypothetical protein